MILLLKGLLKYFLIENYTNEFYIQAQNRVEILPSKASVFVKSLIKNDVLNKYNSIELLEIAFKQLDKRLSARLLKREPASLYFNEVYQNIENLENDFLEFFPQLCLHVKSQMNENKLTHWKL
jgi:acyl carrier protein phosphodiesterase